MLRRNLDRGAFSKGRDFTKERLFQNALMLILQEVCQVLAFTPFYQEIMKLFFDKNKADYNRPPAFAENISLAPILPKQTPSALSGRRFIFGCFLCLVKIARTFYAVSSSIVTTPPRYTASRTSRQASAESRPCSTVATGGVRCRTD